MNAFMLLAIICIAVSVSFAVIVIHEWYVLDNKIKKQQNNLINSLTCGDLKNNIEFFNSLNAGLWIKQHDTSKYEKRMQELNCK